MDRLTIIQNLANRAISQSSDDLSFNSYARFGHQVLAAREDGLYLLGGDDFGGVAIAADFEFTHDFVQSVAVRSLWLGVRATGNLTLSLIFDGRVDQERSYTIQPTFTAAERQHGLKVEIGRDGFGRYLTVRIRNVTGCGFTLDYVEAVTIPLGRRKIL